VEKQELKDLKAKLTPKDVYGKYVSLSKAGDTFVGRCPFHSEKTASFKVDKRDGEWVFHCFGCKKGGDIVRFLQLKENLAVQQAIAKLVELTGGELPNQEYRETAQEVDKTFTSLSEIADVEKKAIAIADYLPSVEKLLTNPEAVRFLDEQRGITKETAERLKLGYKQEHVYSCKNEANRAKGWICFPRIYGEQVRAIKFRSIAEKDFSQVKDMDSKTFFNHDTINPFEPIFVTEGEFDTCIMEQAGFSAVSVPSAGAKLTPEMKDALKLAPAIYLAGDNDGGVGSEYMAQLAKELGDKTFIIKWPGVKDANEYFLKVCDRNVDTFKLSVERLMESAKSTPIEGFTSVIELLLQNPNTDAENDPDRLHFRSRSIDDMNYNPKGSVVIIYSTYTGTGKSVLVTDQIATHEAQRGEIVCVLTPEIRGAQYLALLASQTIGPEREGGLPRNGLITQKDYIATAKKLRKTYSKDRARPEYHVREENIDVPIQYYVGYSLPVAGAKEVIAFLEEVIKRTGCTRFLIDTLHKIVHAKGGESQTDAEGRVAKELENLGIKYGTIFILIGQSNKEGDSIAMSSRDEHGVLRGSRELQDAAASIYLLHRKRIPVREGENPDDTMELKAGLYLQKERFKGKGKPQTTLVLNKNESIFYEAA
jgi:hypothetical protein